MAIQIPFQGLSGGLPSQFSNFGFGNIFPQQQSADNVQGGFQAKSFMLGVDDQTSEELSGKNAKPGQIKERGTAALAQGAASLRAQLRESLAGVEKGFTLGQQQLGAAELAQQIGATEFLAGSKDISALDPFIKSGQEAAGQLEALTGLSGQEAQTAALQALRNSPAFQFNLEQGTKALDRSAAAKGLLGSGRAAEELTRFAQGLAEQTVQQQTERLGSLLDVGQASAAQKANIALTVQQQQAELSTRLQEQQAKLLQEKGLAEAQIRAGFETNIAQLSAQLSQQQQQLEIYREKAAALEVEGNRNARINAINSELGEINSLMSRTFSGTSLMNQLVARRTALQQELGTIGR